MLQQQYKNNSYNTIQMNPMSDLANNILSLRKKNLNETLNKKRLAKALSSLNKSSIQNGPHGIDISQLKILPEFKTESQILLIIKPLSTSHIFEAYINEIYNNSATYNHDKVKYGLYLLKSKLSHEEVDENNINTKEILSHDFINVVKFILNYCKKELDMKQEIDNLLFDIYFILINFSYYSNENEDNLLIEDYMLKNYHYFFIKNSSNYNIIENIICFIGNVCTNSYKNSLIIFQQRKIIDEIIEQITSGISSNRMEIVCNGINMLSCCIESLNNNTNINEQLSGLINSNIDLLEQCFTLFGNLISFTSTLSGSLCGLSELLLLLFRYKKISLLIDLITNGSDIYNDLFCIDYERITCHRSQIIKHVCAIFKIIFELFNESDNYMKLEDNLDNNDNRNNFMSYTQSNEYKNSCFLKTINYIIKDLYLFQNIDTLLTNAYFKINEKEYILEMLCTIVNNDSTISQFLDSSLSETIVIMLKHKNFNIKDKMLDILTVVTSRNSFIFTSKLVNKGLLQDLLSLMEPEEGFQNAPTLIKCLDILGNVLSRAEWIQKINGNNVMLDKFKELGGGAVLEKQLGHPNNEVYIKAEKIYKKYFEWNNDVM